MTAAAKKTEKAGSLQAAVVVSYNPDKNFPERLDILLKQFSRLVIVDNGSAPEKLHWCNKYQDSKVSIINNSDNRGIAAALNQGIAQLGREAYAWIALFDQDSTLESGFVAAMNNTLKQQTDLEHIAQLGANRRDAGMKFSQHRWLRSKKTPPFFERVTCDRIGPEGVSLLITSGTAINFAAYQQLGPFREDFFIDAVDFEYSLRALQQGYRNLVCCQANLLHNLGEKEEKKLLGVKVAPTYHSPLRRYYQFRNRIAMFRLYALKFPHWLFYEIGALIQVIIGILFFEDRKLSKLSAALQGCFDGILGRSGAARRIFK